MLLILQPIIGRIQIFSACCIFAALAMSIGCDNPASDAGYESESEEMHDDHDHDDHDHDDHAGHDHAGHNHGNPDELGPNGGHLVHVDPSHANVEWTHDKETSEITVYAESLLVGEAKVDEVYILAKTAVGEEKRFDLSTDDGAVFSAKNLALMTTLEMEEKAVTCTLVLSVGGTEQKGTIRCEDHSGHDHHGHSH